MTAPAEVTSERAWAELVDALYETSADIKALRKQITGSDEMESKPVNEHATDREPDREALQEEERKLRADFETDGRLDGNYDPEPGDPAYDDRAYDDQAYDDDRAYDDPELGR